MENENKKKIKKKHISPITDEDIYSYAFTSENQSPNIRALPAKKNTTLKKNFVPSKST